MGSGEWGVGAGKEGVALIVNQLTSFEGFVLICHTKYNNLRCLLSMRVPFNKQGAN